MAQEQQHEGSMPKVYLQCGLRIRSEIEMPLPVVEGDGFDVDVVWSSDRANSCDLLTDDVIAEYYDGENVWYQGARLDEGFVVRFPNCGEATISADLARIEVHRDPEGVHEVLPILLAGTISSFLLGLRGETVLHASAVEVDGTAIVFVGQSGRGKTTMAALMCAHGSRLITDDVLVVRAGVPTVCLGGALELRLREKAATLVEGSDEHVTYRTTDDRLAYAPEPASVSSLPVGAIVIPSPSHEAGDVVVTRLAPPEALFTMLGFPRVHGWSDPGVLQRDFETITAVLNDVPVYEAEIPWGPPFDPQIAPAIAAILN